MTDNEIIKLLECCKKSQCSKCYYSKECDGYTQVNYALDLINRQKAEIERLKQRNAVCEAANRCIVWQRDSRDREIKELHSQIAGLNIYKSKIKAEAYKECLAKVKNYIKAHCNPYGKPDFDYDTSIKILNFIDKLAKEMVGDDNA